jgi:hypothetical protein
MSASLRHLAYRFGISLMTVWLVGTALVIGALFVGVIIDAESADPTGLFRHR